MISRHFIALAAALLFTAAASAQTTQKMLQPERVLHVEGDFLGKKGKVAKDLSGIACAPPVANAPRPCLAINDEGAVAQFAALTSQTMSPGITLALGGGGSEPVPLGRQPSLPCPTTGSSDEFDGEGVAFGNSFYYVVGSHGCSRQTGEFRVSSCVLARVPVDAAGRQTGKVERTYRLSDALLHAQQISAFAGRDLNSANGANIEGIAVLGQRVVIGLRAPNIGRSAFLLLANSAELFAPGDTPLAATPGVVSLALGPRRGIRDLAGLDDKRLLILAGPAQEQEVPYSLAIAEPGEPDHLQLLGDLEPVLDEHRKPAKAEAVAILADKPHLLTVVVLFDGLKNGGPRLYNVQR
jgi:hypothetical protein